ncbi:MAG: glycosyltransferase family 4 protein [Candidatus Omnitrophota bacterium]|jgi:glycosyltransferase involved in cell wall biosynthesis
MKVLFITSEFPNIRGGISDYAYKLMESMRDSGNELHVLTTDDKAIIDRSDFCRIYKAIKLWTANEYPVIKKIIDDINPDIVHVHHDTAYFKTKKVLLNLIPFFVKVNFRKIKVITTIHEFRGHRLRWKLRVLADVLFSDKSIFVDFWDLMVLKRQFGLIPSGRLENIPIASNIIPEKMYLSISKPELRKSLGLEKDGVLIFYFGEVVPPKGLEFLISTFEKIAQSNKTAKLLLVLNIFREGYKKNLYQAGILKRIEESIFKERIITVADQNADKLSQYMLASDIAVYPFTMGASYQRGTFLASLAHGMPTLTTYHPDFYPPMIINGSDAVLIKVGDIDLFYEKLEELINNESMREKISVNARRFYEENFSWESIGIKTAGLYSRLASGI